MLTTFVLVTVFSIVLVLQLVLWAVFLGLGLRWAKVSGIRWRQLFKATIAVCGLQIALSIGFLFCEPRTTTQVVLLACAELATVVLAAVLVIVKVFQIPFLRSLQAWVVTLVPTMAMTVMALFVLRPFVVEAFVSRANSMAPTLLGHHCRGTCRTCGQVSFHSPAEPPRRGRSQDTLTICGGFHVSPVSDSPATTSPRDHFLVAKFLTPRRWDIVVFQYPEDPSVVYVKRLVGMPGETIHIEEGAVWANGIRLTPPDSLRGIEYLTEIPAFHGKGWGNKDEPAVLGSDEYFVLGDFSARSKDSRFWNHAADGHHPYAVPASHMRGVVTHIHWPPDRWRVFR